MKIKTLVILMFFLISNIKIAAQTNDFQPTVTVNSQVICANETATLVAIPSPLTKNSTLKARKKQYQNFKLNYEKFLLSFG